MLIIAHTWDGHPLDPAEHATVEVLDGGPDHVIVRTDAPLHADPPPHGPPGPTPGLWEFEVVELFIAGPGHRYLELELGPHGHHLVLRLDGLRRPFAQALPMDVRTTLQGDRWTAEARVPRAWLPEGPHRANAYRIHGGGDARRYLAHAPTLGERPDFHQPDRFVPISVPTEPGSCTLLRP